MQLLKPQQVTEIKAQEDLRQILRAQEMQKEIDRIRLELADAQSNFNATLAAQRQKWATEAEEHFKLTQERKAEIDALEAKRMNALIPIDILKASAEEQLVDAENYAKKVREREEYAEDLANKLQDKLDETGAKQQDLLVKEQELTIRQDGLERQILTNNSNTLLLNQQMAEFVGYKTAEEQSLKEQQLAAINLQQRLTEQQAILDNKQAELTTLAGRLADERGVLDRAWKELERKKISP